MDMSQQLAEAKNQQGSTFRIQVTDIVETYLKQNDFDGLVNQDIECGCGIDDLAPCCEMCFSCEPAIEVVPPSDEFDRFWATKDWTQTERIKVKSVD